ncbi:MAG: helix-turn-helix transcriptional regulator [Bacteroidaceae bacterium]|nr:helix-turn-helix transcriptional regulator [Bacteroidaceae bacterium]
MKNNLRVERARMRMTQQELADRTGVTRQTIVAIEQGKFNPSTLLALKMARVFGVTIEALFELEDTDIQ